MRTVFLCNRMDNLQKMLKEPSKPLRFLNLVDDHESFRIAAHLRQNPQAQELSRALLLRERSGGFRKSYNDLIGRLNSFNPSKLWWAMSFTNKNPFATTLCRDVAYFLLVAHLSREDELPLVVITNSYSLASQIRSWAREEQVAVHGSITKDRPLRTLIKRLTPAGTIMATIRLARFWASSRKYKLRKQVREETVVIATHTHPRSFTNENGYEDAYFGDLVKQASEPDFNIKTLVLGYMVEQSKDQFKKLKTLDFGLPLIPMETCFTLVDLVKCMLQSLRLYWKPIRLQVPARINGLDARLLITEAIKDSRDTGDFLLNLHVFYCAKHLAEKVYITRCVYPFENRSWEKMLLLGVRSTSPGTRMIGYQHTSITPSHTNFMLSGLEADVVPLPDSIFTTGDVPKVALERDGGFSSGMFKVACALRPGQGDQLALRKRSHPINRILVVLATSLEEYVDTMLFLEQAFSVRTCFDVRIRPHPSLFPLQTALDVAPLEDHRFYSESTGSLSDALQWADAVLYASSTVCLEALSLGIPTIYLDLGFFLDTDPMAGWSEFKWSVEEPSRLIDTVCEIDDLSDEIYQNLQQKGREYALSYLSPVTPSRLATFWVD